MSKSEQASSTDRVGPRELAWAATIGWLGATAVIFVELLVTLAQSGHRITSVWELQVGVTGLLPAWLLLGALPGAVGGLWAHSWSGAGMPRFCKGGLLVCAVLFGLAVGLGVSGGRHLAGWGMRLGFSILVAGAAGAGAWATHQLLSRWARWRGTRGPNGALTMTLIATVCLLELANATLLVRLYPAFHLGLSALALVGGGALAVVGTRRLIARVRHTRPWWALLAVGAAGALLPMGSRAIAGFDNFRFLLSEGGPTLAWGVRLTSLLNPPPPINPALAERPLGQVRRTGGLDLRGRSILLVTIDALRADHLGSYGYHRPITPTLDRLAETGTRFTAAYAPTSHTSYSVTSLMTGKYMRPLLLQNVGEDSELFASLLQKYGFRTAAFYPPAVFFIDAPRFERFKDNQLGFEYAKVEFAEGDLRVEQFRDYLERSPRDHDLFLWVHLFGPHEPYEQHPDYEWGERDIDRYDSEVQAADATVGRLVRSFRERDPEGLVMVTADHGEEFGDHGGRYHGTSVYDEQVRVPLIFQGAGVAEARIVSRPVQTIDILPTILDGLSIVIPPRIRGENLTPWLSRSEAPPADDSGRAVAETDDYTLLAEGKYRLICHRDTGACQLFDVDKDPGELNDLSARLPHVVAEMREKSRAIAETHGRYESAGRRADGSHWPAPIVLGMSGNAEVSGQLSQLLDDADPTIRQKAAELLFELGTNAQAPAIRLALSREENEETRTWLALALTRLGQAAPLVFELLRDENSQRRRLAALALAEQGEDAGQETLIRWLASESIEHERSLEVLDALATIRSKESVPVLVQKLKDVRLRPRVAQTLAAVGDADARPHLARAFLEERYQSARPALAQALLELGAREELIVPLRRFLGVPDPLANGLLIAQRAGILKEVGGPPPRELQRLSALSDSGVRLTVVVPPARAEEAVQCRILIRARNDTKMVQPVLIQPASAGAVRKLEDGEEQSASDRPDVNASTALRLEIPPAQGSRSQSNQPSAVWGESPAPRMKTSTDASSSPRIARARAALEAEGRGQTEVYADLPPRFGAKPGHYLGLEVYAPRGVRITALAVVPKRAELPPPPPEPWGDEAKKEKAAGEGR